MRARGVGERGQGRGGALITSTHTHTHTHTHTQEEMAEAEQRLLARLRWEGSGLISAVGAVGSDSGD